MALNNKIELADGTMIDGGVGRSGKMLTLFLKQADMLAHMSDFMDREKMGVVTFYYGAYKDIYRDFNIFYRIDNPLPDNDEYSVKFYGENGTHESSIPTVPEQYLPHV